MSIIQTKYRCCYWN